MPLEHGLLRLLLAVLAGAVIGFERERNDKPAGFRTNILICLGAALFTILSIEIAGETRADGTRIAAQIVTGIGFLGAGTIVHFKGNVIGLTTAATIWTDASIGMAFGAGEYRLGIIATLVTAGVLFGLVYIEELISHRRVTTLLKLKIDPSVDVALGIKDQIRNMNVKIRNWLIVSLDTTLTLHVTVTAASDKLDQLQMMLINNEHVRAMRRN